MNIIAKIEGHGALDIDFSAKKAKLRILEGERLFEGILVGRPFDQTYWITPRICGVCPIVHALASVKAVERAFRAQVSSQTIHLRSLLFCSQMIQSHILHLVFLSLPDYLGLDRGTEIKDQHPRYFSFALNIKKAADFIAETIGGRAVHPTTITAGGFFRLPKISQIKAIKSQLMQILNDAEGVLNLALSLDYPQLKNPCEYLSACPYDENEYPIYNYQKILSNRGFGLKIENYQTEIKEKVVSNSTAKFARRKGSGFMVGALARMALFSDRFSPLIKKYLEKIDIEEMKFNPFYNNLAQPFEILHYTEQGILLCDKILRDGLDERPTVGFKIKSGRGVGVMEAPRGTLYHDYTFDAKGNVLKANIITPTVQNLTHIEEDGNALLLTCDRSKNECIDLIKMLIRAYDPCITCSVH
ncbi:MAG: Nickel-dependent hydrogenase large subunit [Candidatus Berkelbacteria bacterium Licking1014_7]|uniref:Nickel-dependent hydrogenase large subunit n=1 Tax=Candidatus Berkelbacteria bacterium Licking1014_7 TaxID=2017147 RepID=A0A554LJE5_9BACT|nr:MAG: Nickel-dependent hydrogenase large subunit [Candidatus Berkelbacteria bacterium Licking1014_7]